MKTVLKLLTLFLTVFAVLVGARYYQAHAAAAAPIRNTGVITSFPTKAEAVTPTDGIEFSQPSTIYVGVGGNVAVVPENGTVAVTFVGLAAGSTVPVLVRRLMATNTTATDFVRIY